VFHVKLSAAPEARTHHAGACFRPGLGLHRRSGAPRTSPLRGLHMSANWPVGVRNMHAGTLGGRRTRAGRSLSREADHLTRSTCQRATVDSHAEGAGGLPSPGPWPQSQRFRLRACPAALHPRGRIVGSLGRPEQPKLRPSAERSFSRGHILESRQTRSDRLPDLPVSFAGAAEARNGPSAGGSGSGNTADRLTQRAATASDRLLRPTPGQFHDEKVSAGRCGRSPPDAARESIPALNEIRGGRLWIVESGRHIATRARPSVTMTDRIDFETIRPEAIPRLRPPRGWTAAPGGAGARVVRGDTRECTSIRQLSASSRRANRLPSPSDRSQRIARRPACRRCRDNASAEAGFTTGRGSRLQSVCRRTVTRSLSEVAACLGRPCRAMIGTEAEVRSFACERA